MQAEHEMPNVISTVDGREMVLDEETGQKVDPIHLFAKSQHLFAEGPDFLLSDAILYPHFFYLVQKYGKAPFETLLPTTFEWFRRASTTCESHCFQVLGEVGLDEGLDLKWPSEKLPNQSLYKSDPKRLNPSARTFTRQPDIDRANACVAENVASQVCGSILIFMCQFSGRVSPLGIIEWKPSLGICDDIELSRCLAHGFLYS